MKRFPIRRGSTMLRRSGLRRVSSRRRSEMVARSEVVEFVRDRDRVCRALPVLRLRLPASYYPPCCGRLDAHEIVPRSVWREGYLVESNVILVCRAHHDWIHDHAVTAVTLGLLSRGWDRPRPV